MRHPFCQVVEAMPEIAKLLDGRTLILLSNREPYEHVRADGAPRVKVPAGGLVSALDPTMRRTHGVWVAWGSGSADRETADAHGRLMVPPDDPSYRLHRVWLDEGDVDGYYLGFANGALWPLCHLLIQHFQFVGPHWEKYRDVNRRFAEAVAEEARAAEGTPVVWVQDYHFALVPGMLRRLVPGLFVHQFWHIPFPPADILRLLPVGVGEAVLRGMLGNDLLEFHTERYCGNFLDCVAQLIPDAEVDRLAMRVRLDGHETQLGAFPISIDYERYEGLAATPEAEKRAATLRERYARNGRKLGISVDRVDYTKGIPERLRALNLVWAEAPEWRGKCSFVVVATPSRSDIPAYKALEDEVVSLVQEINERWRTDDWTPILLVNENVDAELLASVYRAADLCIVSSLQDGMNLVAKEFIACQVDERGVLVLSRFTGAAEEIDGAVLVNPFNPGGLATCIRQAFEMPDDERRERMHAMRAALRRSTIFDWVHAILSKVDVLLRERVRVSGEYSAVEG